jgi:hypothetical protein
MGCVKTIAADSWPKQGDMLHRIVDVFFHYDTSKPIKAVCVRDDREDPFRGIFRLDDGRYVLMSECQYSLPTPKKY